MRVLHVPYSFYPDPAGGTEIYVADLAQAQMESGLEAAVAAPGGESRFYELSGMRIWRFETGREQRLTDLYGNGDPVAASGFAEILDQFEPDMVHLHAVTSAVSILLAEQVKRRRIPLVLNYHTPTVSCTRGTLLKWGEDICDGKLDRRSCAACTLHGLGLSRPMASAVATLPPGAGRSLGRAGLEGGIWTALRMSELIDIRLRSFHRMMEMADRVVALCEWSRALLLHNGVAGNKLSLCRQGISWSAEQPMPAPEGSKSGVPIRAVFLGRLGKEKGAEVVIEALASQPRLGIALDIFGVRQGDAGDLYARMLSTRIDDDTRIRLLPAIAPSDVVPRLREYDVMLVPSQWLETGPLVVLEAFAAGIPVIGSKLGGIAELVRDGVDGMLVDPPASVAAWGGILQRIAANRDLLAEWKRGILPPRSTRQVALDFDSIYAEAAAGTGAEWNAAPSGLDRRRPVA